MNDAKAALTPAQVIGTELDEDENLLWSGIPDRKTYASSNPFRAIFGRVIFIAGAIALYMAHELMLANPRSPAIFVVMFGIIFTIFGAGLAIKPFWHWWTSPATFYGVTNYRAIIAHTRPWKALRNFNSQQIEMVVSETHADGTGNIIFATEPFGRLRALRAAVGFWGTADPEGAVGALNRLKNGE